MLRHRSLRSQQGQWSLIGMLVTIAIIMILAAWYVPSLLGPSQDGARRSPIERARGAGCSEYESQMNQAVMMYKDAHEGQPPQSIEDLKLYGVMDKMIHAPNCDFRMDPKTGQVKDVGALPTAKRGVGIPAGMADDGVAPQAAPAQPAAQPNNDAPVVYNAPADNGNAQSGGGQAAAPAAAGGQPASDGDDAIPTSNSNPANIHLRDVAGGGATGN